MSERHGIVTGSRLIVNKGEMPTERGEIVVVHIGHSHAAKEWHPVKGGIELRATSEGYEPIVVSYNFDDIEVIGVVHGELNVRRF